MELNAEPAKPNHVSSEEMRLPTHKPANTHWPALYFFFFMMITEYLRQISL